MIRSNLAKLKEAWSQRNKKNEQRTRSDATTSQIPREPTASDENSKVSSEPRVSSLKDMIQETLVISGGIATTVFKEKNFEPLPFTDYSMFQESYDAKSLRINVNPCKSTKHIFIPSVPIGVQVSMERTHRQHFFHSIVYKIKLTHAHYTWEVERTYDEIKRIHRILAKRIRDELGQSVSNLDVEEIQDDWPKFPTDHDHFIMEPFMKERCDNLAEYLRRVLTYPPYRDHPAVVEFLCVSPLSFIRDVSPSLCEDYLFKRTGDNSYYGRLKEYKLNNESFKNFYKKRWFCLKDTYLVHLHQEKKFAACFVLLIDRKFKIKKSIKAKSHYTIKVKNLQRAIVLKFANAAQQLMWFERLKHVMYDTGKYFHNSALLPHGSFAPERHGQLCRWYINASLYMEHVMYAVNNAQEEIYITDWWLWPELYLKRPTEDLQYRLDKVLLKKASQGVKIYILLYKELPMITPLDSSRTKNILTQNGKNPNIKVLRHPEHSPAGVFLWSHHEKSVIIDQSIAFMGGIDLCYGRWDDDQHRLVDLGRRERQSVIMEENMRTLKLNQPQISISNPYTEARSSYYHLERTDTDKKGTKYDKKSETVADASNKSSLSEEQRANARLVAALSGDYFDRLTTLSPIDLKKLPKNSKSALANVRDKFTGRSSTPKLSSELEPSVSEDNSSTWSSETSSEIYDSHRFASSKNLTADDDTTSTEDHVDQVEKKKQLIQNFNNKLRKKSVSLTDFYQEKVPDSDSSSYETISNGEEFDADAESANEESSKTPTPEQDTRASGIVNKGYYWIGKDYANTYVSDFKDLGEYSKDQFDRLQVPRMPWRDQALVMVGECARDLARHFIQRWNQCKREKVRQVGSYPFLLPKAYTEPVTYDYQEWLQDELYKCKVQITRSLDAWSGGVSETELSILNAYTDLIRKAEHYIYIENQFFVTTCNPSADADVKNNIGYELVRRIKKAHETGSKFRVYVVLPLLPGFDSQNAIQAVQYFNLRSIKLGDYSIYKELTKAGVPDPTEYITFHGMRNWSVLMGNLVQEIIYVHSKLMIVDDRYVICGSANINDRSLLGKRDSELAAVITDEEFTASKLNGQYWEAGKYAFSLREKIFKLHLGVYFNNPEQIDVSDCVCDEFYRMFRAVSNKNTTIYDEVFKCIPSDNILTFSDLKNYLNKSSLSKSDPVKGKSSLDDVRGFVVNFPLQFLSKEQNFFPNLYTREGMAPLVTWT